MNYYRLPIALHRGRAVGIASLFSLLVLEPRSQKYVTVLKKKPPCHILVNLNDSAFRLGNTGFHRNVGLFLGHLVRVLSLHDYRIFKLVCGCCCKVDAFFDAR